MDTLAIEPLAARRDNYIWLLRDHHGQAVVVDPGESVPVEAALQSHGLKLVAILLTHHHDDHIGGVAALLEKHDATVFAPEDKRIDLPAQRVGGGDCVQVPGMALSFNVLAVPGHTRSHIAFHGHGMLFSGDMLFSVGCGRIFEGTPPQMLASLDRLAALPADTRVYCGHEYTLDNCAFALSIEPDNAALQAREAQARQLRAQGLATLPSTLADELACNPFLRVDEPAVRAALADALPPDATRSQLFALLRERKDHFRPPPQCA